MARHPKGNGQTGAFQALTGTILLLLIMLAGTHEACASQILVLEIQDAISPPVASYVSEGINETLARGFDALVIRIDTPGGLDTSMRKIIQKEMNAPVPVIVYVSPKGARAASAGAIITLASDIAVMAPGTNIGAAHPVSIGMPGGMGKKDEDKDNGVSTMEKKVTNDAVAYARSIAREKGRNEQWAEDIVKKSISTPAMDAKDMAVIDIVASDMDDLINKLNGWKVEKDNIIFELDTTDCDIVEYPMGARYRFLSVISNPNVAYILMLIGIAGIYFEFSSPGAILPGVIGGISLILAFFAFQSLPVNMAGIALIILAIILFIAEIKVPSFGLLSVGGVISMLLGSLMLFNTPGLYMSISMGIIIPVTLFFCAFFVICVYLVTKAYRGRVITGATGLCGERAIVSTWSADGTGKVFCHGEYWNAKGPADIKEGEKVEVVELDHMELIIKKP
ncbi:MAG: nodulation protein NfeD [Thermodesulfobacteriota bacterium]|nr:nodulation protein NfeD [Thermodesulfobacteriota bacterium]